MSVDLHRIGRTDRIMPHTVSRYARALVFPHAAMPVHASRSDTAHLAGLHDHGFVELALVTHGRAVHRSPQGAVTLAPGDLIVLRPATWHAYEQCQRLRLFNCCFGIELLHGDLAWLQDDPMLGPMLRGLPQTGGTHGVSIAHLAPAMARGAMRLLRQLHDATTAPTPSRPRCLALLVLLLEHLATGLPPMPGRPQGRAPGLAAQAVQLLDAAPAHPWQTRELARRLRVGEGYAIRLVRSATGLSPLAYLSRLRAEHAARLLAQSDRPVSDIGPQVGWPEPAYFARRFRLHFGMSASAYRRQFGGPAVR